MYLRDLFRYRTTDNKVNREDFLSACLAELMRQDREACAAVLSAVGFNVSPFDRYAVRTQVGRCATDGTMYWCDILLEVPERPTMIIECKVGSEPDESQIRRYRKLWNTDHVALLAPEGALPSAGDKKWEGIPRGAWQHVWEHLASLPTSNRHEPFRRALLDLMTHPEFRLHGCANHSAAEMLDVRAASERREPFRLPMRQAVLALLDHPVVALTAEEDVDDGTSRKSRPRWQEGTPFDAYWTRDAITDGLPLYGLGLEARVMEGVGDKTLDWFLWAVPGSRGDKKLAAAANEAAGWVENATWGWERPLGDTGGPDTPFGEQLARAVREARRWLARDLDLPVGRVEFPVPALADTTRDLARDMDRIERLETSLESWCGRLMKRLERELDARTKRTWGASLVNDSCRLRKDGVEHLWFGWEWRIDVDAPFLDLLVGWHTQAARNDAAARLADWRRPPGVSEQPYDKYGTRFRVLLLGHDLATSVEVLETAALSLLDHHDRTVLRALGAVT